MSVDFRESLRTIDKTTGRRLWVYADVFRGFWGKRRREVAYFLIAVYLIFPWLRYRGLPILQVDFAHQQLTLFGEIFWPHELGMLVPFILGTAFIVFAVTSYGGRVWCGWACPQTVFLEFLYRPIEQWIEGSPSQRKKLDRDAWGLTKIWKKSAKWAFFLIFSFVVANAFLAFFIGSHELINIMTHGPSENPGLFITMLFVFGAFIFNFGFFREQTCTIVCPYGRIQSVLLDKRSLIVGYDVKRGEPRGKTPPGDCVNCNRCVHVCPTGIDIRDGLQMECLGCTACMDACDDQMTRLGRPTKLIGYTTEAKLAGETEKSPKRPLVYLLLATVLFSFGFFQVSQRSHYDVSVLRGTAVNFEVQGELVRNQLRFMVENKSRAPIRIKVMPHKNDMQLVVPQNKVEIPSQGVLNIEAFSMVPISSYKHGITHRDIEFIEVQSDSTVEHEVDKRIVTLTLFGPDR